MTKIRKLHAVAKPVKAPYPERLILAELRTKQGMLIYARKYSCIDNAMMKALPRLLRAAPGTVLELSHTVTSMQLGWCKVKVGCKMESSWVWEQDAQS